MGKPSAAAKKRRQRKRVAKGGKRGNKGHFHGLRAAFVAQHLPEFILLKGAGRGLHKEFWTTFYQKYWKKFPWDLPLSEDPPVEDEDFGPSEEDRDGGAARRTEGHVEQDPEILEQKKVIVTTTQAVSCPARTHWEMLTAGILVTLRSGSNPTCAISQLSRAENTTILGSRSSPCSRRLRTCARRRASLLSGKCT